MAAFDLLGENRTISVILSGARNLSSIFPHAKQRKRDSSLRSE
jgi:hypothetical protein